MAVRGCVLHMLPYKALSKSQLKLEGKGFVIPDASPFTRFRFKTLGTATESTARTGAGVAQVQFDDRRHLQPYFTRRRLGICFLESRFERSLHSA